MIAHHAFVETKIPDLISIESLNAAKVQLTIEDMTDTPSHQSNQKGLKPLMKVMKVMKVSKYSRHQTRLPYKMVTITQDGTTSR